MTPTVKLIACTPNPVETIFATEMFAKTRSSNPFLVDPEYIAKHRQNRHAMYEAAVLKVATDELKIKCQGFAYLEEVNKRVLNLVTMSVPVCEVVQLSFQIDHASIAWREQLVRHRVGTSYWIQSGRITDYSDIYEDANYNIPDSIKDTDLESDWHVHWKQTEALFKRMKENGILDQDAREIIGSGALHRLTFTANLRALKDIIGHRTCFIAQQHWHPIIHGICDALVKIDPLFEALVKPPCLDHQNKFSHCHYEGMARDRYEGKDPLPVCPIWYGQNVLKELVTSGKLGKQDTLELKEDLRAKGKWDDAMVKEYADHWHWRPDEEESKKEGM